MSTKRTPSPDVVLWDESRDWDVTEVIKHYASQHSPWLHRKPYEYGFQWQGPLFKPAHEYMDDFPLGTTCWYVDLIVKGRNFYVCADSYEQCVKLAHENIMELLRAEP